MKVAEKFTSINGEARAQENLQYLFVLKGVTCDAVIVILCGTNEPDCQYKDGNLQKRF